jgi:hypothetical protein
VSCGVSSIASQVCSPNCRPFSRQTHKLTRERGATCRNVAQRGATWCATPCAPHNGFQGWGRRPGIPISGQPNSHVKSSLGYTGHILSRKTIAFASNSSKALLDLGCGSQVWGPRFEVPKSGHSKFRLASSRATWRNVSQRGATWCNVAQRCAPLPLSGLGFRVPYWGRQQRGDTLGDVVRRCAASRARGRRCQKHYNYY